MKPYAMLFLMGLFLLSNLLYGQPVISVVEEKTMTIGRLPTVTWIWHIGAADDYIGVIYNDRKEFTLFGPEGKSMFSVSATGEAFFYMLSMKSQSGLVLLGEAMNERRYRLTGYDYKGNIALGPLLTGNSVEIENAGRFFYSVYDYGGNPVDPAIYDSTGRTLAEYKPSGMWDIQILDSSRILCRNDNQLRILDYPSFTTGTSFEIPYSQPQDILRSAVSPDGFMYAFVAHNKIVIINLKTGDAYELANRMLGDKSPAYPHLTLTSKGDLLIINQSIGKNQTITIFERTYEEYKPLIIDGIVPVPASYGFYGNTLIDKAYLVCSYFATKETGIEYASYVFPLPSLPTSSPG